MRFQARGSVATAGAIHYQSRAAALYRMPIANAT